jgi:hypothetical protein
MVLLADDSVSADKLALHAKAANEAGTYLRIVTPAAGNAGLQAGDALATALAEQRQALSNAETIVVWTEGISGLQALIQAVQADPERANAMKNQNVVVMSNRSLGTLARTARGPYSVLQPQRMVLTRSEAMNPLLLSENFDSFLTTLGQRDIEVLSVTAENVFLRPWDALSTLVNYMLTHGVSSQTVLLLLMLPLIATILAFFKQIIGITTLGLYTPSIIALSFLALGWWIGLLFLLFILATGYFTRSVMRRWRMLYIPKASHFSTEKNPITTFFCVESMDA